MSSTVNAFVVIISLVFTLVCILAGGLAVIAHYWERIADARKVARETPKPGWQYEADITALDRWCCWHFPIIEDVCAYLLQPTQDIGRFREALKAKYGDREIQEGQ